MGTWGVNLLQDDTASDVYADYFELFNAGKTHSEIARELKTKCAGILEDEDEAPIFWMVLACAQWECGVLTPELFERVSMIVSQGVGLNPWKEAGEKLFAQRKRALQQFIEKIRSPNTRPRQPKKAIRRKPIFRTGDCLSILLSDGDYGAAIVLDCPQEVESPGRETYGINLIGQLHYKSKDKPNQSVFETRRWLQLTHHKWDKKPRIVRCMALRFRKYKHLFEVVGSTRIRPDDPRETNSYNNWAFGEQMVLQAKWDFDK
jgi:hypothetical protein